MRFERIGGVGIGLFFFLSLIACDSLDKGGLGVGLWN